MRFEEVAMLFKPMEPGSFAEKRYQICQSCENFRDKSKMCKICNCIMPLKARIPSMSCPDRKWGQVL